MLNATEANRRSNEHIGLKLKALLDEVEQAILARCEEGCKSALWEVVGLPDKTRFAIVTELRRLGYKVDAAQSGIFIRW